MIKHLKNLAATIGCLKSLRVIALACALALLPFGLAIGATASSATTVTKEVERHTMPDPFCRKLTQRTGCYEVSTMTEPVAKSSPLAALFVVTASAWQTCYGPITSTQSYYAAGTSYPIASGHMRYQVCGQGSYVELVWGPSCWVSTAAGWGGGVNYCDSPARGQLQAEPTWTEENWYLFPYSWPWWHINNIQEWGVYFLGVSLWYECADC